MATKVVGGQNTRWKVLEGAWVVGMRGLEFRCCTECNTPHDCVVPNFGVTEFTEFMKVFWSTPEKTEKTEKTRGSRRWVHYGQYTNWSYHT